DWGAGGTGAAASKRGSVASSERQDQPPGSPMRLRAAVAQSVLESAAGGVDGVVEGGTPHPRSAGRPQRSAESGSEAELSARGSRGVRSFGSFGFIEEGSPVLGKGIVAGSMELRASERVLRRRPRSHPRSPPDVMTR